MKKEILKTKLPLSKDSRAHISSMCAFDLPVLIEKMKQKHSWAKGEINTMILLKSSNKQIVLTALHNETEIKSFQSNDSITFQLIEGNLLFHTRNESVNLDKGQLLTLHENIKYSLTTKAESVMLVTIATTTNKR